MKMIKTVLISVALLFSGITSAHAMGDREKGALIGAGAVLLLPSLVEGANNLINGEERSYRRTTYVEPRPRVVYREEPYVRERVIVIEDNPPHYAPRHHGHHGHHHYDDDDRYYRYR